MRHKKTLPFWKGFFHLGRRDIVVILSAVKNPKALRSNL